MTRTGMANLLTRLRGLTNDKLTLHQDTTSATGGTVYWTNYKPISAGTVSIGGTIQAGAAYSLDQTNGRLAFVAAPTFGDSITIEYSASQFTDTELQDLLDANVTYLEEQPLQWLTDTVSGGSIEYHRASVGYRDLEEWDSGTVYWRVTTGPGSIVGTSTYTPDYITGQVRFAANQGGSAYYLTARSYDLYNAAADVWQRKQAAFSEWYQFQGDGQSFARQQAFDHAVAMERQMRSRAGQNKRRGSVSTGVWQRTDLVRRCGDADGR